MLHAQIISQKLLLETDDSRQSPRDRTEPHNFIIRSSGTAQRMKTLQFVSPSGEIAPNRRVDGTFDGKGATSTRSSDGP